MGRGKYMTIGYQGTAAKLGKIIIFEYFIFPLFKLLEKCGIKFLLYVPGNRSK